MASSGSALLALLSEPQPALQVHALKALNHSVNLFWSEIASFVHKIESMCEDQTFPERSLAACLVSKVFYHLEALDDSLKYALSAGDYFDINSHSEYTETLIAKCVDEYTKLRIEVIERLPPAERDSENVKVDPRLESIIGRVFQRCFEDSQLHQAIGIAVESQRLDMISASIKAADSDAAKSNLIWHCLNLSLTVVKLREFRQRLLRRICALCTEALSVPDSISHCHCLIHLDDAAGVAKVLGDLCQNSSDQKLTAYQIAYDIAEIGNYPFQQRVIKVLSEYPETPSVKNLSFILSGESSSGFYRQFLYSNAATDLGVMATIKEKVEGRNSVTHCAAIISHAFMQCGTSRDQFIRDHLDWLARANNWAKMSVTAAFGVIHKDHVQHAHAILKPYLSQEGVQTSAYLKAGALYGLGLIYANRGGDQQTYLEQCLRSAPDDEVVQHGACLALGLNSLSAHNSELYDTLKEILFHDNAVAGEAAGLAMGLVMLGSGSASAIEEMCAYAHETQHEKIIRGLGMGLALIMSGREEHADGLVTQLMADKDYNLRYGACFTLALAFASTANPSAVKRLLHIAVSDVSVDVRRAAVIALGFVLACVPERVPKIVSLLCESYSPQVRYGAALAIGIACAGTALRSAIDLLMVLCKDRVDFVRQGAMIGMAMVVIQTSAAQEPDVTVFRNLLTTAIEGKHTDTQTKMGAILAQGMLDAGGRNMTIALRSGSTGHRRPAAIAGMAVFVQYWYWYPLLHFFSLTLQPTAIIALNENLSMPAQKIFVSQAKPSIFAYPPIHKPKQEEQVKKMPTAQLSISAKAKAKQLKKKRGSAVGSDTTAMDVDQTGASSPVESSKPVATSETIPNEPDSEQLQNPSRVTPAQRKVIICPEGRYVPIKKELYGIVIVNDTRPGEPEELVEIQKPKVALGVGEEEEPQPPAPFQFTR